MPHFIRNILCFSIMLTMSILSACQNTPKSQVELDINFFTSDICAGRLPGSAGNSEAEKYIHTAFEAAGLEPLHWENSLLKPYQQEIFATENQQQTLIATFPDGTTKLFRAGEDYYPCMKANEEFFGVVSVDIDDPNLSEKVWMSTEDANVDCKAKIIYSDKAMARISHGESTPVLRCDENMYRQLEGCTTIEMRGTLVTNEASVNNIVGVRPGTDGQSALLITAHYDHVGGYGDVIYPGAFDNASGVAAMLETLRQVVAKEIETDYDLVFVAFNGEDMGQLGSKALVSKLPYKTVNVINLDCIGLSGNITIGVTGGQDSGLQEKLIAFLDGETIECVPFDEAPASDHISFESFGIPAVTVSSYLDIQEIIDVIHHPQDTPEQIDARFISLVAQQLCQYVEAAALMQYSPVAQSTETMSPEENAEWKNAYTLAEAQVESLGLEYDEILPFEVDGQVYIARDISHLLNAIIAEKKIPELHFPLKIGGFMLDTAHPLYTSPFSEAIWDQDDDERHVTIYKVTPEEAASYKIGQPQPVSAQKDRTGSWQLYYSNQSGDKMRIVAFDRNDRYELSELLSLNSFSRYTETEASGGTIYQRFSRYDGNAETLQSIFFTKDELPYYYVLYNNDLVPLAPNKLLQFLTILIPNLDSIPRLP